MADAGLLSNRIRSSARPMLSVSTARVNRSTLAVRQLKIVLHTAGHRPLEYSKLEKMIGGAAAWPVAARAQQSEQMRRVGMVMSSAAENPEGQAGVRACMNAARRDSDVIRDDDGGRDRRPPSPVRPAQS